jgi:histone demethylase JARID1
LHMLVFCRASENIFIILASLNDVKEALSEANSWLRNSKPYLVSSNCVSNSVRKVEDLQVHVLSCLFYRFSFAANIYIKYDNLILFF